MYERYFVGQFFVVMSRRFARFVCGAFVRVGMDSFYCMVQYAPCDFFVDKPTDGPIVINPSVFWGLKWFIGKRTVGDATMPIVWSVFG